MYSRLGLYDLARYHDHARRAKAVAAPAATGTAPAVGGGGAPGAAFLRLAVVMWIVGSIAAAFYFGLA